VFIGFILVVVGGLFGGLSLSLFVFRIFTQNEKAPVTLNNLAIFAHFLD